MEQVPNHILSPQHFTQVAYDHHPVPEGMGSEHYLIGGTLPEHQDHSTG